MAKDKIIHFSAGYAIALIVSIALWKTLGEHALIIGFLVGGVSGVAKEIYDIEIKKTEFDGFDMFATILGSAALVMTYGVYNIWV